MSGIPIYKTGGRIPENQKFYFLLAEDGVYLHKETPFYATTVKVKGIDGLGKVKEELYLLDDFKKIPWSLIQRALNFFRAVYDKHSAEGILLLGFDKKNQTWSLIPVEQEVAGASVNYKAKNVNGAVGSIHSHPDFGAFYSGTDDKDDFAFDGIHIVLGQITKMTPQVKVSASVNGTRFTFKPEQVIEDIPKTEDETDAWVNKFVKEKTYSYQGYKWPWKGQQGGYRPSPQKPTPSFQPPDTNKMSQVELNKMITSAMEKAKKGKENREWDAESALLSNGDRGMPPSMMEDVHFEQLCRETTMLSPEKKQELAEMLAEELEGFEDQRDFEGMKIEEIIEEPEAGSSHPLVTQRLFCPACGNFTHPYNYETRWCPQCRIPIQFSDLMQHDRKGLTVLSDIKEASEAQKNEIETHEEDPEQDPEEEKLGEDGI